MRACHAHSRTRPNILGKHIASIEIGGGTSDEGFSFTPMSENMYSQRAHFIAKLNVVLLVAACARLVADSGVDASDFAWHLRPHHVAEDFQALLALARKCFHRLSSVHQCWCLFLLPLRPGGGRKPHGPIPPSRHFNISSRVTEGNA